MVKPIKSTKHRRKLKLLLHVCCACCATEVYNRLKDDYEVTLFWYNPNIEPLEEYENRFESFCKLAEDLGIKKTVIDTYKLDNRKWHEFVKRFENEPEGGERCKQCYKFRLEKTAQFAYNNSFNIFTTTLTISPHKNAAIINQIGNKISKDYEIDYLESDFKKEDGFKKSIEFSHKYNLYRQHYCGCEFSIR